MKISYKNWRCSQCGSIFETRRAMETHRKDIHKSIGRSWAKGLTANTDERIKKRTDNFNKNEKLSEHKNKRQTCFFVSKETREKISKKQKENYRGKSRYATAREGRKSYAEQYFDSIFTDCERNYHVDRFFLDYAWIEKKVYIEVDGEQHYTEDGLKRDKERTMILENLGWKCLKRIRWSEYQKMNFDERKEFLENIFISAPMCRFKSYSVD